MKKNIIIRFIEFLIYTKFGNGYSICAVIFPLLIFGLTAMAPALMALMLLIGFILFVLIYNADKIKEFIEF